MKTSSWTRLVPLTTLLVAARLGAGPEVALPTVDGPFDSTQKSLLQFECPDWFRDAKFGIWAHWGPQAVPMFGDWYARHLYVPGQKRGQYEHHLGRYGHASVHGWKDIIPLWKAEKFDPDRLMFLYKAAGAKYFVSMAVHHDNFDLWDSKHHRWNAVKMGPQRDIVGAWQTAAKKQGLPFGVSEHLDASFWWWQVNKDSDKSGPHAGVPYDGTNPAYEDLYDWKGPADDTRWYTTDTRWHQEWFRRINDLVTSYHPDLLYTDGGLPFGVYGRRVVANLYNDNLKRNKTLQAVYTAKQSPNGNGEFIPGSYVQDLERGLLSGISPLPWQTDTSIGDWFYNTEWKAKDTGTMYRSPEWVIRTLVDIVSKNGNLLLNVIQRPDGSIDPEAESMLRTIGAWMKVNGEAIYGTRPWTIYGEGPASASMTGGHFKEDFSFTAEDFLFTTKAGKLFAIVMALPKDGAIVIKSLGSQRGRIDSVRMLGYAGKLDWRQSWEELKVSLPADADCRIAVAFEISGEALVPPGR